MEKVKHGVDTLHSSPRVIMCDKIKDSPSPAYQQPFFLLDL